MSEQRRRGGAFYDAPGVLDRYRSPTPSVSNPKYVMEEPALLEEIGAVRGSRVLDLGCGDASIGRTLLAAGCVRYLGLDGSQTMVAAARATLADTPGEVMLGDIEDFEAPEASFELVISRLALHYVENISGPLRACHTALARTGRIVFSVVHPVISSHDARVSTEELRSSWVVDGYFDRGAREQRWLGDTVTWYHRTIEDYVTELQRAGFALTALRECHPRRDRFERQAEFDRRQRIPMFLILAGARA